MIRTLNSNYRILFNLKIIIGNVFRKVFAMGSPNKWSVYLASELNSLSYQVKIEGKEYSLVANNDLTLYRSKTFFNKEPETTNWIKSISKDKVFFDVGANVGVYTVLASVYCKKVYAFEPVALNYSVLTQNLMRNGLDSNTAAYCVAVSDKSMFDSMRLSSTIPGTAHHTFGIDRDACHKTFNPVFKQGSFAVSLDDLVYIYNLECPNYLKIDVDGNEFLIVSGAKKLLKDPRLESILIELNKDLSVDSGVIEEIKNNGFYLKEVGEEACLNGMKIGNLIFNRKTC